MSSSSQQGPLSHIKVVEVGSFIAGPFCGQTLADLGAEVIKIEPPGKGDTMRQWGVADANGHSLWWPVIGRNKMSVTLDLRQSEGREIARKLILQADVLVENFRPGTLERWGLDPEELRSQKPSLIVARVSGYGQTGPYRELPGFAAVAEAAAGLRHLTGYADRQPTRTGISIGDSLAGLYAAIGVLASLVSRPERGRGQVIDAAITDSVLAVLESVISEFSATGIVRGRSGTVLPGIAPSNLYPTSEGGVVLIAANADTLFRRLAIVMERPGLSIDPRYQTHAARGKHQVELDQLIAEWSVGKTADEIVELLQNAGIPCAPVNDSRAVTNDPHFRFREAIVEVETAEGARIAMQGTTPKLSETPTSVRWAGPKLGAHTEEILSQRLNVEPEHLAALRERGIV